MGRFGSHTAVSCGKARTMRTCECRSGAANVKAIVAHKALAVNDYRPLPDKR
jgi:hypothetical protein